MKSTSGMQPPKQQQIHIQLVHIETAHPLMAMDQFVLLKARETQSPRWEEQF